MLLADCGSSWSKTWRTETGSFDVIETKELLKEHHPVFDVGTGQMARGRSKKYINELLALAEGALRLVDDDDFTIVDVGARDTKYCGFVGRRSRKLDWNQSCGAATGFTLELLARYYQTDFDALPVSEKRISVSCAVFGIERIFDNIIKGGSVDEVISRFVHGIAFNVFTFAHRPEKLYLSGGLCQNPCFVKSLARYCQVVPLGRHVLLHGLVE